MEEDGLVFTFGQVLFVLECCDYIHGFGLAKRLKLLAICDLHIWAHVVGAKPEADLQVFVAEDLLFLAKNLIGEFGMEVSNEPQTRRCWGDETDIERVVRIGEPYRR